MLTLQKYFTVAKNICSLPSGGHLVAQLPGSAAAGAGVDEATETEVRDLESAAGAEQEVDQSETSIVVT